MYSLRSASPSPCKGQSSINHDRIQSPENSISFSVLSPLMYSPFSPAFGKFGGETPYGSYSQQYEGPATCPSSFTLRVRSMMEPSEFVSPGKKMGRRLSRNGKVGIELFNSKTDTPESSSPKSLFSASPRSGSFP